jgi:parallel beta-helix repeat protein
LDPAATLQSIPNAAGLYAIVSAINVENSGIYGGTIQGDRTLHTGSTGEWGMGIFLKAVNNFEISDVLISDCWGDGVYITDDGNPKNPSRNVRVDRIISTNNRRQGLSAINWIGGHIKSSIFENMNGAPPEAGIDFEPNPPGLQEVSNILISNNTIRNNRGLGLYFAPYKVENNEVSYNNLHGNSAGIAVSSSRNMFLRNIVSLNREGGIILTDRRGHENYNAANNRFIENIIFQNSENAPNPVADITILGRAAHNEFIQNVIGSNSQKAQTCCYGVLIESANSVGNQFVGNKFVGTWKTDVFRDGGTKTIRSETTR